MYTLNKCIHSTVLIFASAVVMLWGVQAAADTIGSNPDNGMTAKGGHGGGHHGHHHGHQHHGHHKNHHNGNHHNADHHNGDHRNGDRNLGNHRRDLHNGYWNGNNGEWGGHPGYYSDPNFYYNGTPSVPYVAPVGGKTTIVEPVVPVQSGTTVVPSRGAPNVN